MPTLLQRHQGPHYLTTCESLIDIACPRKRCCSCGPGCGSLSCHVFLVCTVRIDYREARRWGKGENQAVGCRPEAGGLLHFGLRVSDCRLACILARTRLSGCPPACGLQPPALASAAGIGGRMPSATASSTHLRFYRSTRAHARQARYEMPDTISQLRGTKWARQSQFPAGWRREAVGWRAMRETRDASRFTSDE